MFALLSSSGKTNYDSIAKENKTQLLTTNFIYYTI